MRGVLVGFATERALQQALDRLAEDVSDFETYTPVALDEQTTGSPLPLAMFVGGMLGFVGFFLLMAYADLWAYPLDIGGRPDFAWPSFVPIAFELARALWNGNRFCRLFRPVSDASSVRPCR